MKHNGREIIIEYLPFPKKAQGACSGIIGECQTCYIILIDSTRHPLQQRHTLGHELAHLFLNHLEEHHRPVREKEREANKLAWYYYRKYKAGDLEAGP